MTLKNIFSVLPRNDRFFLVIASHVFYVEAISRNMLFMMRLLRASCPSPYGPSKACSKSFHTILCRGYFIPSMPERAEQVRVMLTKRIAVH